MAKIIFVNSSPNANGNTAGLAAELLKGHNYETINLTDYRINFFGQDLPGDQFDEVIDRLKTADVLVFGSPVYWHNICGTMRTFIDRFYGAVNEGDLHGKMFFIFQGGAPEKWMLEAGEYTMSRFARLCGLDYQGMASNRQEAKALARKL